MKNVISFSLWGDHPKYWTGALLNISTVRDILPGWICRFYVDITCSPSLVDSLRSENTEIVLVKSDGPYSGMFWRFLAADDPSVDVMLSRDCDSRFTLREILAIYEWLNSDKDFHIMRDHPDHRVPVLGGMWGCRRGILRDLQISKKIEEWGRFDRKGIDQDFLGEIIYPLVKDRALEHSEFGLSYGGPTIPFPTKRVDYHFVGEIFDENNQREEHWRMIQWMEASYQHGT